MGVPTQHVLRKILSALYSAAIQAGHVSVNPISMIELPAEEERDPRFLSVEEIDAIAAELSGTDRTLLLTLAYTGLRVGEAIALRVADVDLERRRITVRSSISNASVERLLELRAVRLGLDLFVDPGSSVRIAITPPAPLVRGPAPDAWHPTPSHRTRVDGASVGAVGASKLWCNGAEARWTSRH